MTNDSNNVLRKVLAPSLFRYLTVVALYDCSEYSENARDLQVKKRCRRFSLLDQIRRLILYAASLCFVRAAAVGLLSELLATKLEHLTVRRLLRH